MANPAQLGSGLKSLVLALVLVCGSAFVPTSAEATLVGLGAEAEEPSECLEPQGSRYASASCQLFAGSSIRIFGTASRDDGSVRLAPQPFSLLQIAPRRTGPVLSFTYFDENDGDDDPALVPRRNTDYQLHFNGNADIGPADSAPLVVSVGARVTIPQEAAEGRSTRLRVPARVTIPWPGLRGRLELRRCHRAKATSAASCARRRDYTVLARRRAERTRSVGFVIAAPPRSSRRYEIVFRPNSSAFTATRQAFGVVNGFDGTTVYRPTVRASAFGDR